MTLVAMTHGSDAGTPAAPSGAVRRSGAFSRVRFWLVLALVVAVVLAVRTFALDPLRVSSGSMEPTLGVGDTVLVDKVTPHFTRITPDELVVFHEPTDGALVVKRVVATAGQVVEFRDAVLFVDGRARNEPYVDLKSIDALYFGPVTVPPGHVFVLGDHRAVSIDSRHYGSVEISAIVGRVAFHL